MQSKIKLKKNLLDYYIFGQLICVFLPILFSSLRVFSEQYFLIVFSLLSMSLLLLGVKINTNNIPAYIKYFFLISIYILLIPLLFGLSSGQLDAKFMSGLFGSLAPILIIMNMVVLSCYRNLSLLKCQFIIKKYILVLTIFLIGNGVVMLLQHLNIFNINLILSNHFYLFNGGVNRSTAFYARQLGRYTGIFSVPVVFGSVYSLCGVSLLYLYYRYRKLIYLIALLLVVCFSLMAITKVSIFVLTLLLVCFTLMTRKYRIRLLFFYFLLISIMSIILYHTPYFQQQISQYHSLWAMLFQARVGRTSFVRQYYNEYVKNNLLFGIGFIHLISVDSGYLWVVLQSGIFGLMFYCGFLYFPVKYFLKGRFTSGQSCAMLLILLSCIINLGHPIFFSHHFIYVYLPLVYLLLYEHVLVKKNVKMVPCARQSKKILSGNAGD